MAKKKAGYPSIDRNHEEGFKYLKRNPFLPPVNVSTLIKFLNSKNDKAYIKCLDLNVNYQELLSHAKDLEKSLLELGVNPGIGDDGPGVVVCAPNFIQNIAIFLAANNLGVGVSFLSSECPPEEVNQYLNLFEAEVFVGYNLDAEKMARAINGTKIEGAINIAKSDLTKLYNPSHTATTSSGYKKTMTYNQFANLSTSYKGKIKCVHKQNQAALYLFTGGSTGISKIPVLTNRNIIAATMYAKNSSPENASMSDEQSVLVTVPFCYPYGFLVSGLMSLMSRKHLILAPDLTLANISKYIAMKPNYIFGTPPFYRAMRKNDECGNMTYEWLVSPYSGGDTLASEENVALTKWLEERGCKAHINNGMGNAEMASLATSASGREYKPETVGFIAVGIRGRALDPETLEEKKYGEEGILTFSSKSVTPYGYYKDPEQTAKAFRTNEYGECEFISDTMGAVLEDGSVTIIGRESRFIITFAEEGGAHKSYLDFVQSFIRTFPEIEQCAVVGMPDAKLGEVAKAYIVLNQGYENSNETIDSILERCKRETQLYTSDGKSKKASLKPHEIPVKFEVVPELPKNNAGKMNYLLLAEHAAGKGVSLSSETIDIADDIEA